MDLTFGLGGLWSSWQNQQSQEKMNAANIAMQRETNAMQVDLANTSYQRKAADMLKAGINPLMAAGGAGAATPALNAPKGEAPKMDTNAMKLDASALLPLLTMANQVAISNSETARAESEARKASADADRAKTEAGLEAQYGAPERQSQIDYRYQQGQTSAASADLMAAELKIKQGLTPSLIQQAKADAKMATDQATFSRQEAETKAGMNDTEYRILKQMISENIGPVDQMWSKMSAQQQEAQLNAITNGIKKTEAGIKILELIKKGATLPADIAGAYIDAGTGAKKWGQTNTGWKPFGN